MTEPERLIENDVYATYHTWAGYIETDPDGLEANVKVTVQDTSDYGDGQPMRVALDGYGLFEISVSVKRLPGGDCWRECAECNHARHTCPGCGDDVEHGQTDCGAHDEEPQETDVAASLLAEGDEIFSAATGAWHAVKEASSHAGRTTIVIDRNDGTSFRFQPAPETTFRTRRGAAGRKADLWGAEEVIHSA